ncbi:MAG TPA: hypothetical protein VJ385_07860 [Fibrobacteria bacterium]|nr:hypothetical protein [Fibrobacteria bacterium]
MNCTIPGLAAEEDYWTISGGGELDFEMIDCKVLNTTLQLPSGPWLSDKWRLDFSSGGLFHAKDCAFTRAASGFDYITGSTVRGGAGTINTAGSKTINRRSPMGRVQAVAS